MISKSLKEIVLKWIAEVIEENVLTSTPAIIIDNSKYTTEQVVTVQPLIKEEYPDGESILPAKCYEVPVVLPGTAESVIAPPLKNGDLVMMHYCKRSLEELLEQSTPEPYSPVDRRVFSKTDAFIVPGLTTRKTTLGPLADDFLIKYNNAEIILKASGAVEINGATITPTGNVITASGTDLDAFKTEYDAHVHGGVTTGGGSTGTPI